MVIGQDHKLLMSDVLATPDGSLRKTKKATLDNQLEKKVTQAEIIPDPSSCMAEGMRVLQKVIGLNEKYGEHREKECIWGNIVYEHTAEISLRIKNQSWSGKLKDTGNH